MSFCACAECQKPLKGSGATSGDVSEIWARVQSPIEDAFLKAFVGNFAVTASGGRLVRGASFIEPQARIGPFSADFIVGTVFNGRSADLAVELDGHEFHAKTPEQVEGDRKRDRAFVRLGVVVLRFTGREVTRDAKACVTEVEQLLENWLRKPRPLNEGAIHDTQEPSMRKRNGP